MTNTNKIVLFIAAVFSLTVIAAQNIDISQAQNMCAKATPQQKQMAKAAGYDLDSLCSSLTSLNAEVKQKQDSAENIIKPREVSAEEVKENEEVAKEQLAIEKTELKPFGYDLFAGEPSTFEPANLIPVPSEYTMGPGDEVRIQLFGKVSQQLSLVIDRNGNIQFPELGPIALAGLSFDETKRLLQNRIKQQMIGVESAISLGELKSIQVFVLGEAYRPGSYTVSSLSTMTHALFVSGGIKTIGSLRNVQLKRNGKLIQSLDLYDLLLKGDTSKDVRLFSGDVIYIPPVGKTAAIDGAVKRPGIYEVKEQASVFDLVQLAGGYRTTAFKKDSRLTRISDDGFTHVIDLDLSQTKDNAAHLAAGDLLYVTERIEVVRQFVKLSGHVYREKQLAFRNGLRVSDLISSIDELKPLPQVDAAVIIRNVMPLRKLAIEHVNIAKALTQKGSEFDLLLHPEDELVVFGLVENREIVLEKLLAQLDAQATAQSQSLKFNIGGMVKHPGAYPLASNLTIARAIALAGGLAESAYTLQVDVTRTYLGDNQEVLVKNFTVNADAQDFKQLTLQPRDVVNIRQKPEFREYASVELIGEVVFPGNYRIKKGETLTELIKRAGGFNNYAHINAAVFTREDLRVQEAIQLERLKERLKADVASSQLENANAGKTNNVDQLQTLLDNLDTTKAIGRLVIDLESIMKAGLNDVVLKDGDKLFIPEFKQEVTVIGEVQYPTSHLYDKYLSVDEYIQRSGGETDKADDARIYVVKANGSVVLPNKSGWISAAGVTIEPGDTIVVPVEVDNINNLTLWTQVSQIVYQMALGAAAIRSF